MGALLEVDNTSGDALVRGRDEILGKASVCSPKVGDSSPTLARREIDKDGNFPLCVVFFSFISCDYRPKLGTKMDLSGIAVSGVD